MICEGDRLLLPFRVIWRLFFYVLSDDGRENKWRMFRRKFSQLSPHTTEPRDDGCHCETSVVGLAVRVVCGTVLRDEPTRVVSFPWMRSSSLDITRIPMVLPSRDVSDGWNDVYHSFGRCSGRRFACRSSSSRWDGESSSLIQCDGFALWFCSYTSQSNQCLLP